MIGSATSACNIDGGAEVDVDVEVDSTVEVNVGVDGRAVGKPVHRFADDR